MDTTTIPTDTTTTTTPIKEEKKIVALAFQGENFSSKFLVLE